MCREPTSKIPARRGVQRGGLGLRRRVERFGISGFRSGVWGLGGKFESLRFRFKETSLRMEERRWRWSLQESYPIPSRDPNPASSTSVCTAPHWLFEHPCRAPLSRQHWRTSGQLSQNAPAQCTRCRLVGRHKVLPSPVLITWPWQFLGKRWKNGFGGTQVNRREIGVGEEGQEAKREFGRWRGMHDLLSLSIISHDCLA